MTMLPPSIGYIFNELKIGLISFQLAWLYSIDRAMGQVMVWFSEKPKFFQALELSCTFQFEDHILHQLHQTTPTAPNCTKYATLHQTTSSAPTAPNCTHKTTLTTPEYINYTNYTNHTKLHQTTPATPVSAEKFDDWHLTELIDGDNNIQLSAWKQS